MTTRIYEDHLFVALLAVLPLIGAGCAALFAASWRAQILPAYTRSQAPASLVLSFMTWAVLLPVAGRAVSVAALQSCLVHVVVTHTVLAALFTWLLTSSCMNALRLLQQQRLNAALLSTTTLSSAPGPPSPRLPPVAVTTSMHTIPKVSLAPVRGEASSASLCSGGGAANASVTHAPSRLAVQSRAPPPLRIVLEEEPAADRSAAAVGGGLDAPGAPVAKDHTPDSRSTPSSTTARTIAFSRNSLELMSTSISRLHSTRMRMHRMSLSHIAIPNERRNSIPLDVILHMLEAVTLWTGAATTRGHLMLCAVACVPFAASVTALTASSPQYRSETFACEPGLQVHMQSCIGLAACYAVMTAFVLARSVSKHSFVAYSLPLLLAVALLLALALLHVHRHSDGALHILAAMALLQSVAALAAPSAPTLNAWLHSASVDKIGRDCSRACHTCSRARVAPANLQAKPSMLDTRRPSMRRLQEGEHELVANAPPARSFVTRSAGAMATLRPAPVRGHAVRETNNPASGDHVAIADELFMLPGALVTRVREDGHALPAALQHCFRTEIVRHFGVISGIVAAPELTHDEDDGLLPLMELSEMLMGPLPHSAVFDAHTGGNTAHQHVSEVVCWRLVYTAVGRSFLRHALLREISLENLSFLLECLAYYRYAAACIAHEGACTCTCATSCASTIAGVNHTLQRSHGSATDQTEAQQGARTRYSVTAAVNVQSTTAGAGASVEASPANSEAGSSGAHVCACGPCHVNMTAAAFAHLQPRAARIIQAFVHDGARFEVNVAGPLRTQIIRSFADIFGATAIAASTVESSSSHSQKGSMIEYPAAAAAPVSPLPRASRRMSWVSDMLPAMALPPRQEEVHPVTFSPVRLAEAAKLFVPAEREVFKMLKQGPVTRFLSSTIAHEWWKHAPDVVD